MQKRTTAGEKQAVIRDCLHQLTLVGAKVGVKHVLAAAGSPAKSGERQRINRWIRARAAVLGVSIHTYNMLHQIFAAVTAEARKVSIYKAAPAPIPVPIAPTQVPTAPTVPAELKGQVEEVIRHLRPEVLGAVLNVVLTELVSEYDRRHRR